MLKFTHMIHLIFLCFCVSLIAMYLTEAECCLICSTLPERPLNLERKEIEAQRNIFTQDLTEIKSPLVDLSTEVESFAQRCDDIERQRAGPTQKDFTHKRAT